MQGELQAALAKLWEDARPRLLERVEALDAAVAAPGRGDLHERARIEAHTLIGTLGSFGRTDLSDTARAAEAALERGDHAEVARAAAALRAALA
jgi:hypothetical protein